MFILQSKNIIKNFFNIIIFLTIINFGISCCYTEESTNNRNLLISDKELFLLSDINQKKLILNKDAGYIIIFDEKIVKIKSDDEHIVNCREIVTVDNSKNQFEINVKNVGKTYLKLISESGEEKIIEIEVSDKGKQNLIRNIFKIDEAQTEFILDTPDFINR